jgi:multidrug efflux system membrane fusion protein
MVHPGNLVRANDPTPLVVINQVTPVQVAFGIPERQLALLKQHLAQNTLRVEARPQGDQDQPAIGRIAFVDNAVDQTTGMIRIKGTFANGDRRLWPGQFVNVVTVLATDPDAIVVPSVAVQTGQQGTYVFVVKDDRTVELRPVTIARTNANDSIVAKGLKDGETVVTDGQLRLVPGSRISDKTAAGEKVAP